MDPNNRRDTLLLPFIAFSLLLHLLIILLLPQGDLFPVLLRPKPVIVELLPPAPRQRELDLPARPEPEKPRDTPAKRLGPSDQVTKRETAPKGSDPEDMRQRAPALSPPRPLPAPRRAAPGTPPPPTEAPAPKTPAEHQASEIVENPTVPSQPIPDLDTLTQLPPSTVARLEEGAEKELRRKYRPEVEEGNSYWLDTEKDILISFFERFRNNIYAVWSYPPRARERGEEGVCLLKVTVNRDGTLRDVRVMESSGFPLLDDEAVAAVKKGAPFGELHRAYEEETISIFAFFQYNLTRINQRRPGSIY